MQMEQYRQLLKAADENAYISIGVSADGEPVRQGFVPWERTVSAFNMKPPKLTVSASDLGDDDIMSALGKCRVAGCYIFAPLSDYSFISRFGEIRDLFILHGENVRDLSFVRNLRELFMFYLEDAVLPDLGPLVDVCNAGKSLPGKCFGFRGCRVADTSALAKIDFVLSELLIWPAEGDSIERWRTSVKPGVFRFYG